MLTLETKTLSYSQRYKSDGCCYRVVDVATDPRGDVEINSKAVTGVYDDKNRVVGGLCGQDSRQL